MNGLRQVWRDINRIPYPSPSNPVEPTRKTTDSLASTGETRVVGISNSLTKRKARILIATPKAKPLNRNDKIRLSLERAYPSQASQILDQAYAAYYYTRPASPNLPELYELLESGFLDLGIEACGLHSWVIGRVR